MEMLKEVGLGYVQVGQPATTLPAARRSASNCRRSFAPRHRQDALHPRRADHRPPLRGRPKAARSAPPPRRPGQHGGRDRTQSGRHQDRRLGDRPGPCGGVNGGKIIAEGPPERIVERHCPDGDVREAAAGEGAGEAGGGGNEAEEASTRSELLRPMRMSWGWLRLSNSVPMSNCL